MVNDSNFTTYISLSNQPCITTLVDLSPDEYYQGLRYYPFMVNADRCIGSCNTLHDSCSR